MKDPILLNRLWHEVKAGRVAASQSGPLTIFKYTQKTHIRDLWNAVNRQARGIIFQTDGTVIARPFEKFFNLNERPETHVDNLPWKEGVEIYEKVDGSCGIGYLKGVQSPLDPTGILWNKWHLATPGSMESDQAIEGTRMLNAGDYKLEHLPLDSTPVFEIIYPENRIVVDYDGKRELVLLAIFEHNGIEWHPCRVDQIASMCGFRRPQRYNIDLRSEIPFEENSEGYVARFENGLRVKVKSPAYLRVHRLLNYLSPKGVIELMRGKEYGVTLRQLPKAIAADFDDVRAYVQGIYNGIYTRAHENLNRLREEHHALTHRRDLALWIQANVPNAESGFVFALLDHKDIEDKVWKLVLEQVREERGKVPVGE